MQSNGKCLLGEQCHKDIAVKEPPFSLKETAEVQSHHFVYCWQVKDESQMSDTIIKGFVVD